MYFGAKLFSGAIAEKEHRGDIFVQIKDMEKKHLLQPFEIFVSDIDQWNQRPLIYHFFELVQIIEGEGIRIVNENNIPYQKGSLFLFTPLDCRGFESMTPTKFCSIRFSEVFLEKNKSEAERTRLLQWLRQLEMIFTEHNRFQQLLIKDNRDCKQVTMLIQSIVKEFEIQASYYAENLDHYITLILNIIARNMRPKGARATDASNNEPLINKMLVYLHQNITSPSKLKIKELAAEFNLSPNYVGEYFKNITGESLRCYINDYRLNMLMHRLQYSELTIDQIADEFGFADSSHFSKHFKRHKKISPQQYRKNMLSLAL